MSISGPRVPTAGAVTRLISSNRGQGDPQYSPDGRKIAFKSGRSGPNEIWVSDAEGQEPTQLTHLGGSSGSPRWSPDGSLIAFDSRPKGNPDIFVIRADGGPPRRITSDPAEDVVPSWSHDGKWIYFSSNRRGGEFQIWSLPAERGESSETAAVQVTEGGGFHAIESADGKYLYFSKSPSKPELWRREIGANSGAREAPVLESIQQWSLWTLSRAGVYFFQFSEPPKSTVSLKFFHFESKRTYQIATLPKAVESMTLSPDGHQLVYTQVERIDRDLMLVENFR